MDDATKAVRLLLLDLLAWGWTQMEISGVTDVAQSMLSNVIHGQARSISHQAAINIIHLHTYMKRSRNRAPRKAA